MSDARIQNLFGDCVWTRDPWFLRPQYEPWFSREGVSRSDRECAVIMLARLYPPDKCKEMLRKGHGRPIVFLLQEYLPWFAIPLVALGRDLAVAEPWDDTLLLRRLRTPDTYESAVFEVGVWANLVRNRYFLDRLHETNEKTHDFTVRIAAIPYYLEVKTLERGEIGELDCPQRCLKGPLSS